MSPAIKISLAKAAISVIFLKRERQFRAIAHSAGYSALPLQ
jgi:hypothetical protein